jgi:hypothetical protein
LHLIFRAWLQIHRTKQLSSKYASLSLETPWQGEAGEDFRHVMLNYLRYELTDAITALAQDDSYTQDALSERPCQRRTTAYVWFPNQGTIALYSLAESNSTRDRQRA